jgi:predicted acyltransferase
MTGRAHAVPQEERLLSIDALRGFDMFLIVGGGAIITELLKAPRSPALEPLLAQTDHVPWEGFVFWDLIMPLFLFIVGVVMPFSFAKRLQRGDSKKQIMLHVLKRSAILFVLGIIVQGRLLTFDLHKLHIYCNTLQAIAAGYLGSSVLLLFTNKKQQAAATAALLLIFWAAMALIPFGGHPAGTLLPDANFALHIDNLVLGRFGDGTPYTWVFSSLTFICSVMLGVFAGHILRSDAEKMRKFGILVAAGAACLVVSLAWDQVFPIIKHIWTSSFVLFAGGLSFILLALFYLVIDVWNIRKWSLPFVVIGANAIAVYTAFHVFDFRRLADSLVGGLHQFLGTWYTPVQALTAFALVWGILYYMYRKKTFIKI